jgi:hypothetical protein
MEEGEWLTKEARSFMDSDTAASTRPSVSYFSWESLVSKSFSIFCKMSLSTFSFRSFALGASAASHMRVINLSMTSFIRSLSKKDNVYNSGFGYDASFSITLTHIRKRESILSLPVSSDSNDRGDVTREDRRCGRPLSRKTSTHTSLFSIAFRMRKE